MSKRFTETIKWDDPWFRKLPPRLKCLWQFICDRCDNSGVWMRDLDLANVFVGESVTEEEALKYFNDGKERIVILNSGHYWLVKEFVQFQFGELHPESRTHQHVLGLIEKHRVSKGYPDYQHTPKDKDKDKDKDTVKAEPKARAEKTYKQNITEKPLGEYVHMRDDYYMNLVRDYGLTKVKEYVVRLDRYIGQNPKKNGGRYTSHYHVILSWMHKDGIQKAPPPVTRKFEPIPEEQRVDPAKMRKDIEEMTKKIGVGNGLS